MATAATSRATDDRQSTTVPKVSNTRALTAGAAAPPCETAPTFAVAITIAPVCRNSRRDTRMVAPVLLQIELPWFQIDVKHLRAGPPAKQPQGTPRTRSMGCEVRCNSVRGCWSSTAWFAVAFEHDQSAAGHP